MKTYTIFLDNASLLFIKTKIESKTESEFHAEMKRKYLKSNDYIFLDNALNELKS